MNNSLTKEELSLATSIVAIDKEQLLENWRILSKYSTTPSMVMKANAYGLGIENITPIIYEGGCRIFWVANLIEAIELRTFMTAHNLIDSEIYALAGIEDKKYCSLLEEYEIIPLLGTLEQLQCWKEYTQKRNNHLKCAIHIDTGMNRISLVQNELDYLKNNKQLLSELNIKMIVSHLSSADELDNPENVRQKKEFEQIISELELEHLPKSLAASDGALLGKQYLYDNVRLATIVYGHSPLFKKNTIAKLELKELPKSAIKILTRIVSVHEIKKGESIGYEGTYTASKDEVLATLGIGYADGMLRKLYDPQTCNSYFMIGNKKAHIVGKISMDYTVVNLDNVLTTNTSKTDLLNQWAVIGNQESDLYNWLVSAPEVYTSMGVRIPRLVYDKNSKNNPEIPNDISEALINS